MATTDNIENHTHALLASMRDEMRDFRNDTVTELKTLSGKVDSVQLQLAALQEHKSALGMDSIRLTNDMRELQRRMDEFENRYRTKQ